MMCLYLYRTAVLGIALGLLLLPGCGRRAPNKMVKKMVSGGGSASSGNLWISSGNMVLKEGTPGLAFALVKKPSHDTEFSYFVVFRHDYAGAFRLAATTSENDGKRAVTKQAIEGFGQKVDLIYEVQVEPLDGRVIGETLTVGDKPVDISAGRVLLIDLSVKPPQVEQKKVDLPSNPSQVSTTEQVEELANETLAEVRKRDAEIGRFVKPSEK